MAAAAPTPEALGELRRVVRLVAVLNLAFFFVELLVAQAIGSVSLLADSIDFLEDASINVLVLVALPWPAARRAIVGRLLALLVLAPGVATLWTAWGKFLDPSPPEPVALATTAFGALCINLYCALRLVRLRFEGGSLMRAAFLSARNDVFANAAVVAVGLATQVFRSGWPDLLVGLAIFALNLDAARAIHSAARAEADDGA